MDEIFLFNITTSDCDNVQNISSEEVPGYVYDIKKTMFILVCLPVIVFVGAVGNLSFLFVVFRAQHMRNVTNFYLANLATVDISLLLTTLFRYISGYVSTYPIDDGGWFKSRLACSFPTFLTYLFSLTSEMIITVLSFERYLAICHPIKHRLIKGKKTTLKLNIFPWFIAATSFIGFYSTIPFSTCYVLSEEALSIVKVQNPVVIYSCLSTCRACLPVVYIFDMILFTISALLNTIMYISIVRTLRRRSGKKSSLNTDVAFKDTRSKATRTVARMLIVNTAVFFICLTPIELVSIHFILFDIAGFQLFNRHVKTMISWTARVAFLFNSAINPWIYSFTNPRYRRAFLDVFCKRTLSWEINS